MKRVCVALAGSGQVWHVAWGGTACEGQHVEVSKVCAESLGLPEGAAVTLKALTDTPAASTVSVEPASADDWEIISAQAAHIEDNLLNQVGHPQHTVLRSAVAALLLSSCLETGTRACSKRQRALPEIPATWCYKCNVCRKEVSSMGSNSSRVADDMLTTGGCALLWKAHACFQKVGPGGMTGGRLLRQVTCTYMDPADGHRAEADVCRSMLCNPGLERHASPLLVSFWAGP